ncbi:MAG TPA: sensor histidine kinase [Nocardioides sp.]|nr:sensor histidine kinase [Nocardioides sp.]
MSASPRGAALEERRRIARELHDGVAQLVVALGYRVEDIADLVEAGPVHDAVALLRDEVSQLARELRRALGDLRAEPEVGRSVSDALSSYVDEIERRGGLRVHLAVDERGEPLPGHVEREVLRIAREAITNVDRHARAINLWVRLVRDDGRVRLVVEDDGIGAVVPRPGHFGIQGMRERAEQIGGVLEIGVRPDGGTVVTLWAGGARVGEGESHDRQRSARR